MNELDGFISTAPEGDRRVTDEQARPVEPAGMDTALKQDDAGGFGFGGLDLDV